MKKNKRRLPEGFVFEHIGIAVPDIRGALSGIREAFGSVRAGRLHKDRVQKVNVVFADLFGARVEFVEPLYPGASSPVDNILKNNISYYHICFSVPDLDKGIADMVAGGAVLVTGPAPAIAYGGANIAFLFSRSLGLVELVERRDSRRKIGHK